MDLIQISRNFDIPEGQHVTGVKVWYEQIDRSTVSSFQLKLFHPMLKETRGKVSRSPCHRQRRNHCLCGENKIVYHDSVQGRMFCVFIRNRPTILPRNSPFSQTEKRPGWMPTILHITKLSALSNIKPPYAEL